MASSPWWSPLWISPRRATTLDGKRTASGSSNAPQGNAGDAQVTPRAQARSMASRPTGSPLRELSNESQSHSRQNMMVGIRNVASSWALRFAVVVALAVGGLARPASGQLGTVSFANSGAPGAQPTFLRGLAL